MNREIVRVDVTDRPELARLAEEVSTSMQPQYLEKDGETLAMVTPVASKRRRKRAKTKADEEAFLASAGSWKGLVDADQLQHDLAPVPGEAAEGVSTMERVETNLTLPPPPSPQEIKRRQALLQQILANHEHRVIAPLTSADLVHEVREEECRSYDDRR